MSDLLPCPFCGGEASMIDDASHSSAVSVGCFSGKCAMEPYTWDPSKAKAIVEWNTRAIPAVQPDLTDPIVVHANMVRGTIAKPTLDQIIHLYGVDALCRALVPAINREAALDEMARLGQEFDAALKGETP